MLVESGGSGGAHAYLKIAKPLAATRVVKATGELVEPIERANLRLVHHLGVASPALSTARSEEEVLTVKIPPDAPERLCCRWGLCS